jgi:hypothetical protein
VVHCQQCAAVITGVSLIFLILLVRCLWTVKIEVMFLWNITPCIFVGGYLLFGGACFLYVHHKSKSDAYPEGSSECDSDVP